VLKIFFYAFTVYKLYRTYYCIAQVHCSQSVLDSWKLRITKRTFYVEIVSIILERPWVVAQSVWRETTDEKWKN